MKKLILLSALSLFLVTSTTPVYAHPWRFHLHVRAEARTAAEEQAEKQAEDQEKTRAEEIRTKVTEFKAAAKERQLALLKDLCAKMVNHREKELDRLQGKVDDSKLTEAQKDEINTTIKDKEEALTTAKSDCDKETDTERLKTKLRDVQKKQRIFHSILPKLHGLHFIDRVIGFIGRLEKHVATIQKHIDKAEAAGCDVTEAEAALADYQAAVQAAQDHLNKAKEIIADIKEAEDAGTLREQLKAEMQAMVDALKDARDAHKKIIAELKACRKGTETTEPTPSPTPTP